MDTVTNKSDSGRDKRHLLPRIGNFLLLLTQIVGSFALVSMILSRDSYEALSKQLYPQSDKLMDSAFLNIFMHKEVAILLGLLMIATIAKEFFINSFRNRVVSNVIIFAFVTICCSSIVYLLYSPVF